MKIQRFVLQVSPNTVIGLSDGDALEAGLALTGKRLSRVRALAEELKAEEQALSEEALAELGEKLFEGLFTDSILDRFRKLYSQVNQDDSILRVELIFSEEAQMIAGLPWEFLRVPVKYQIPRLEPYLAVSGKVTVVRNVFNLKERKLRRVGPAQKLRVAVAVSQPKIWAGMDRELGAIDPKPVIKMLDKLREARDPRFAIDYEQVIASKELIRGLLRSYEPYILHFIGHGDVDQQSRDSFLVLIDDETVSDKRLHSALAVPATQVGKLFDGRTLPTVVILQACNTAVGDSGAAGALSNTAAELAKTGIPLVVAFQYEMMNNTASAFARRLYEGLAAGESVEVAVNEARRSLLGARVDRGFGTPVVFVTTPESQLFSRSAEEAGQDQLAKELLALPGIDKEASLIADIYAACIKQKITNVEPKTGPQDGIGTWIEHLARAIPEPGKSRPLAYFAATLADRVLVSNRSLANALKNWIKNHATELDVTLDNLNGLILRDPEQKEDPYLQVILTQYATTDNFNIMIRDGSLKSVLFSAENVAWKDLGGQIFRAVGNMTISAAGVARLWIEVFLPTGLLSKEVEQLYYQDEEDESKLVLGRIHRVVVCSGYRLKNRWKPDLQSAWSSKWTACHRALLNDPTPLSPKIISDYDITKIEEATSSAHVVGLLFEPRNAPPSGNLLTKFLKSGVPVAVWIRDGANTQAVQAAQEWLNDQIDKNLNLPHLSEFIREERKTNTPLGNHLVLLWDNFDHNPGLPDSFGIS